MTLYTAVSCNSTRPGVETRQGSDYFGFELGYEKAPTVGSSSWINAIQYNGNITGMIWKSVHDGQIRKYDFSYDNVNRLMTANFTQYTGSSFNQTAGINYTANNLSYDANGNILNMTQYGLATATATTSVAIDQLTYTPITGTNKLQSVADAANGNTVAPGAAGYLGDYHYASGAGSGAVYTYDNNGNLTGDNNKHISSIAYNYLNLPQTISVTGKGSITYTYDAAGNKLQKQTIDGSTTTTTLYGSGTVYVNNVIQFILHEEGRIRVNSTNNGYIFDYFLKDHLGNTRMTITDDNTAAKPVIDATSYYPFGLTMAGISLQATGGLENKIKFQKQELQHKEFSDGSGLEMYEFKYRMDDPQTGRFWQIDPLADKYLYNSTYAFSENKVTNSVELEGLESVIVTNTYDKDHKQTGTSTIYYFNKEDYGPLGEGTYTADKQANGTFSENFDPAKGNSVNGFYADGLSQSRWTEDKGNFGGFETRLNGRLIEKQAEDGLVSLGFDQKQVQKDVVVLETDNPSFKGKFAGFASDDVANKYTSTWSDRPFSDPHKSNRALGSGQLGSSGLELKYYDGAKSKSDAVPGHLDMERAGLLPHILDWLEGKYGSGNPGLSNAKKYKDYQE